MVTWPMNGDARGSEGRPAIDRSAVFGFIRAVPMVLRNRALIPRVLSLIPPMTQLNTPYPSTAYLTGFCAAAAWTRCRTTWP
jgi:hypothetical protein